MGNHLPCGWTVFGAPPCPPPPDDTSHHDELPPPDELPAHEPPTLPAHPHEHSVALPVPVEHPMEHHHHVVAHPLVEIGPVMVTTPNENYRAWFYGPNELRSRGDVVLYNISNEVYYRVHPFWNEIPRKCAIRHLRGQPVHVELGNDILSVMTPDGRHTGYMPSNPDEIGFLARAKIARRPDALKTLEKIAIRGGGGGRRLRLQKTRRSRRKRTRRRR